MDAPGYGIEYIKTAEAAHAYPVTRMLWEPVSAGKSTCDLLATSGDHLRLWSLPTTKQHNQSNSITRSVNVGDQGQVAKLQALALLSNSKSPEYTAPLTSLDWNALSPSLIITSSIDTTCTIWDIPSLTAKTQLIAHDKEVFDVRFCAHSADIFVSCGADGSVRMFDLRSLEHSTIIYEPSDKIDKSMLYILPCPCESSLFLHLQLTPLPSLLDSSTPPYHSPTRQQQQQQQQTLAYSPPLLRIATSPHDAHLLATFSQDSSAIRILDVRQPGQALLELHGHQAALNCVEWSPSRRGTLASGGDDSLVLVWDLVHQNGVPPISNNNNNNNNNNNYNNNNGAPAGGAQSLPLPDYARGPVASWSCDYEVNNISWAPRSRLTGGSGSSSNSSSGRNSSHGAATAVDNGWEWLGVTGGRGIWGVSL